MAIIKCKMCGGDLAIEEGSTVAECEYCGTRQTVPTADSEKKLTLFTRANRLLRGCEFDKAAGVYESIVAEFPEEAEAYWGLVLCRYGIEYVDDPATAKKIPTCHRSGFESVLEDKDFEMVMEYADLTARRVYRDEAKQIEELRKAIIEVSGKEEPYDIFICYKESDPDGGRTLDSVIAQDIYDALTEKGYRVFFSRITLEDKLGQEYEPYIFAALNSAKVMLAVGTDYEYYNAVWVKNEWSRFLALIAKGEKKVLIPCFKNLDPYDMPKEFARLQSQDMGKVGAMQDLLRGIDKIIGKKQEEAAPVTVPVTFSSSDALTERGKIFLEDGDFQKAIEYYDKALDTNPHDAKAYLGLFLANNGVKNTEEAKTLSVDIENSKGFQRALKYAADADKAYLQDLSEQVNRRFLLRVLCMQLKKIETMRAKDEAARKAEEERKEAERKANEARKEAEHKAEEERQHRINELAQIRKIVSTGFIGAGQFHTVGLRVDGTVVATEYKEERFYRAFNFGQSNVFDWRNIVAISAGWDRTSGLRADGTAVFVGGWGEKQVSCLKNIVAISAGHGFTVCLRTDGTVVAVGCDRGDVSGWTDIVAVSAGDHHTVGLRADGTVIAVGQNNTRQCNIDHWRDIVAISAGGYHTVGLHADGTVSVQGGHCGADYTYGREWKLFNNIDEIIAFRREAEETYRKAEEERQAKIKAFNEEKAKLQTELPNLQGIFKSGKRKEAEARLAEIEKELKKLNG